MFKGQSILRTPTPVFLLALAVALVAPGESHAERKACSPNEDPAYSDTGERIKCKMENMTESFDALVTTATDDDTGLFTEVQKKQLGNLKERAKRETDRVNPTEYKQQAKKSARDVECVIRELIGDVTMENDLNNNGICDEDEVCLGNEDGVCQENEFVFDSPYKGGCAELLDDGVGDEDGICDPTGKSGKFREVCLKDCRHDTVLAEGDEKNVDKGKADDVEQAMEDMTEVMDEANDGLEQLIMVRRSTLQAEQSCSQSAPPCEYLACLGLRGRSSSGQYITDLATAAASANALLETCRDVGNQTVPIPLVGGCFDGLIACLPIGIAANGVLLAATAVELRDDIETAERVDAIAGCTQSLGGEVQEVKALVQEIVKLLQMPPGQRPGFPVILKGEQEQEEASLPKRRRRHRFGFGR
jgi:hypothetical protein